MKTTISNLSIRFISAALLAVAMLLSALAFAPGTVFAATSGPTPPAKGEKQNAALEAALVRLNDWNTKQAINLREAGTAADKLQALIDKAKAKGKDVSALESAMAAFDSQLSSAQTSHDQAAAILSSHNGFDTNGKVTDPQTARQTILNGRKNLSDAHITLQKALADLRAAVRDWREANRPAPKK